MYDEVHFVIFVKKNLSFKSSGQNAGAKEKPIQKKKKRETENRKYREQDTKSNSTYRQNKQKQPDIEDWRDNHVLKY